MSGVPKGISMQIALVGKFVGYIDGAITSTRHFKFVGYLYLFQLI